MGELLSGYVPDLPKRTTKTQRNVVSYFVGGAKKFKIPLDNYA